MITKIQTDFIKEFLGWGYTSKIVKWCKDAKMKTIHGNDFPRDYIATIVNGDRTNEKLEDFIWQKIEEEKEKRAKKAKKINAIMQEEPKH